MTNENFSNQQPGLPHWPSLDYEAWKNTCATLHMWTLIVGKIRLAQTWP